MWELQERKVKGDLIDQQGGWECPSLKKKHFFQGEMAAEADRYVHLKHTEFVFPSYVQKPIR